MDIKKTGSKPNTGAARETTPATTNKPEKAESSAAKPEESKPRGWQPKVDLNQVAQTATRNLNDGFNQINQRAQRATESAKNLGGQFVDQGKQLINQGQQLINQGLDQARQGFDAAREFMGTTRDQALQGLEQQAHRLREALGGLKQDTTGMTTIRRGDIEINVRPLNLNIPPGELQGRLDQAMADKARDDEGAYGALVRENGYSSLEDWSRQSGYYGSDSHRAWAEAASARTGGQVPADWWMKFDPFGGTAGTGPEVLPQGEWPGVLSTIAMGHDTDWSLGRYFGAGPMAALKGAPGSADDLGLVGLAPQLPNSRFSQVPLYTDPRGMSDWVVRQNNN